MFCTSCGTQLPYGATTCPNCSAPVVRPGLVAGPGVLPIGPAINNYLVPSVLVTLCCCLPVGVVAIIYAAQVNTKLSVGDYAGAEASAKSAKMWCWIGFSLGVAVAICYGIVTGLATMGKMGPR
jgi:hypothetical protein